MTDGHTENSRPTAVGLRGTSFSRPTAVYTRESKIKNIVYLYGLCCLFVFASFGVTVVLIQMHPYSQKPKSVTQADGPTASIDLKSKIGLT